MQEIIIIAGPNGAGKASFANKHFDKPRAGLTYLNADGNRRVIWQLRLCPSGSST